jgi:hypothetical protein
VWRAVCGLPELLLERLFEDLLQRPVGHNSHNRCQVIVWRAVLEVKTPAAGWTRRPRRGPSTCFSPPSQRKRPRLSALLGIARSYTGAVLVETVVNAGSFFKVYLPALPPQEAEAPIASPQASQPAATAPAGAFKKCGRILVVDDKDAVRQLTSRILDRLGFEPLTAVDGESAFSCAFRRASRPARPDHPAGMRYRRAFSGA